MDPSQTIQDLLAEFRSLDSTFPTEFDLDNVVSEVETFYPSVTQIIQSDDAFFETERILFGHNISQLYNPDTKVRIWKLFQMTVFSSFFHGDIKTKIGTLFASAKSLWSSSGQTNDEVERILSDENTESHFEEMFEYVTNLRSAKLMMSILEEIDLDSVGLAFDNPIELINTIRDPESPVIKKCVTTIQKLLKQKLERGEFSQQQLMSDIEGVKAKGQSLFGNLLNEALGLGGRRDGANAATLMSNAPEARRQRMLARLQRKQREKTQR